MELDKTLKFTIGNTRCTLKTLLCEDVSQSYVNVLKKARGLIENVSEDTNIKWQQSYIKKILQSPCDTICGLFINSELIGTSGIQNLSVDRVANRAIALAQGYTYGCTLGILVLDEGLRGKGYGSALVWAACYLLNDCCMIETFEAGIKKGNIPSLKSFLSCGFKLKGESTDSVNVEVKIGELVKPEFIEKIIIG